MYVHVKPNIKKRVLSLFMAFAIIFVSLPYVGIETSAADGDSTVVTSSKSASVSGSYAITGGTANYTGKILDYANSPMELYDYISDQELNSTNGSTITNSHASGNTDQHTYLNNAISTDGEVVAETSPAEDNLTLRFKTHVKDLTKAYVYLFDDSSHSTGWSSCPMTWSSDNKEWYYTFIYDDIGFTPTKFIVWGDSSYGEWQTDDITCALEKGSSYLYDDAKEVSGTANKISISIPIANARAITLAGANKRDQKLHLRKKSSGNVQVNMYGGLSLVTNMTESSGSWVANNMNTSGATGDITVSIRSDGYWDKDGNAQTSYYAETVPFVVQNGKNYTFNDWNNLTPGTAYAIMGKTNKYTKPMYFGCFWRETFNDAGKANYNNFYWLPNMSLQSGHSSSSVQNLVDLTLGPNGQLRQDGQELPYFSKTLANSDQYKYDYNGTQRNMIECYDDLDFKFYQIQTNASNVTGYESGDTGKANFYQFNSQETYLYFDGTELTESTEAIKSQGTASDANGTTGFYPFNRTNNSKLNNLAFGAKFTIKFKLSEDGKVETIDGSGNGTGKYVNEIFEFKGDDDVWVFIDDNLVLDLGGVHKDTSGYIDFAEKKAVATSAVTYTDATRDNLNVSVSQKDDNKNTNIGTASETFAFTDLLKDKDYYRTNKKYNPETVHTMTLFYMERGMFESDLLVRFNFETVSNKNTLKVSEVTDFTDVNDGLKSVTRQAADNDVFQYTVSNKGTINSDTRSSGIQTPTYDYYQRTNDEADTTQTAMLTGDEITSTTTTDTTHIYFDIDRNLGTWTWHDSNAVIAAWIWGSSNPDHANKLVKLDKVSGGDWLYRLDFEDYTKCKFIRLNPEANTTFGEGSSWPSSNWGVSNTEVTITDATTDNRGKTYKINSSGNGCDMSVNTPRSTITYSDEYEQHNYTPGATLADPPVYVNVGNTNYLWTDEYAEQVAAPNSQPDDQIDGMTATTDSNGMLPLMYGTDEKESSAFFKYQFKTDSDMKVIQNNALLKPNNRTTAPLATHIESSGRNVNTYYTTTVAIEDAKNTITDSTHTLYSVGIDDTDSNNYKTEFDYVNTSATLTTNSKAPVEITETFTNKVKTGSISITKALDPDDNLPNKEFEFRLTLTKVLGTTGTDQVDVADDGYDDIKASLNGGEASASYIDANGKFKLKKGQTLVISGIPVGTEYTITESDDDYYKIKGITKDDATAANMAGTISDHTDTFVLTNERKTGSLTLSKSFLGEDNAATSIQSNDTFTFKVALTEPDGVDFSKYSVIWSEINGVTPEVVSGKNVYTLTRTVGQGESGRVTISGIPYGTVYKVYENTSGDTNNPTYVPIDGTIENPSTVANLTNIYRKITMTKEDSKDSSKKLNDAVFYLLKLNDKFDTDYANNPTAVEDIFKSAESYADDGTGGKVNLKQYYDDFSGTHTTATVDGNDGIIVVKDSQMTNGLTPGKYFFFEEIAPNEYYERDNSFTCIDGNGNTIDKIIEIKASTTQNPTTDPTYTRTYTDERKLCALIVQEDVLQSTTDAYGASASQSFTVSVTLDGTDSDVDIDPRAFFTNSDLTGMGVTTGSIDRSENKKLSFTLPVSKGSSKNIVDIPLGVSYTVSDTFSDITGTPSGSSWKRFNTNNNLSNDIKPTSNVQNIGGVDYPTETTYIKNAMVGSLVLSKALANGTNNNENRIFDFNVNMTIPSDVNSYTLQRTVGAENASDITGLSGKNISVTQEMSVGTNVTISNVPYGTTYNVSETEPGEDWGIINQVNTTNNTINNTTTTTTITNGKVGKLNLNKIIAGEYKKNGIRVGDDFEFTVTLTNTVNSLSNIKVDGVTPTINDQYNVTLTISVPAAENAASATPVVISNIPYGTTYSVSEVASYVPTETGAGVSYATEATQKIDGTNDSVTATNTYVEPPPMNVTINMTKTDAETGAAITNIDASKRAKYVLLKLNENVILSAFSSACATNKTSTTYTDLSAYYSAVSDVTSADENGKITLSNSDFAALGSVYPGDMFYFFETAAPEGYKVDNSYTEGKLITIVKGTDSYNVRYTDEPESTNINLFKKDQDGNPLAGAIFSLFFKESYNPPTNSINESEISPKLLPSKSINSTNTKPTPPEVSNTGEIKSTQYSYTAAEAPDASESTWILPRTDNDYIYFRDYNIGSTFSGDSDSNRKWINTWFDSNEFGQSKEIFYDHRYWLKAVFTANGKETREYSVWERFVDKYDSKDTVVWKIQPPDGYEYVEFILCDGADNNNHVRNTEKFKYVLGNIYTKTNKGKYDNGQYGYPVKGEHWSTYWDSTTHDSDSSDERMTYSTSGVNTNKYVFGQSSKDVGSASGLTSMAQADRYIATPQKLVFHCNSKVVWHNIHIEFFDKNQQPIGQKFPGYMMEPYAYAGNDYRINGYLTYELTIPKDAKYFRVNDGITMGSEYGYYSKITEIYEGDTNKYYKIDGSYINSNQKNIKLVQSTSFAKKADTKYTNQNEIESDYDYVYFATPKDGGWSKVYAYFYGGGDLQADNWQRACYSIWPGLAPVGTEYEADENGSQDVKYHSDIYTYTTNPDSTFEFKFKDDNTVYTVYKFRVPSGDRTNYKKVIFNNGLSNSGGGKTTSPIEYSAGYIYKKSGSSTKHYEEKNTYTYTGRGDELYVKMNSSTLANWDDLHITFYDSGKNQILQGKDGYVMKYSGTDTSNTYFSMPIPINAAYFSLNNGINKSDSHNLSLSDKYEILPLNASGDENTSQNFTKGNMVYTLSGSTLSKTLPEFTEDTSSSEVTLDAYPSPRGDYIYIRNDSNVLTSTPTFAFYESETSSTAIGTTGLNLGVNTHSGSPSWYSVGIPTNATYFTMNSGTKYPIYQKTTQTTTSDLSMNFTPGNMYYSATGNQTLSLLWPTFDNTSEATSYDDDNWGNTNSRGDALYLVCGTDKKSSWNGMTVTFYDKNGNAIKNSSNSSDIHANYVGALTSGNPAVSGQSTTNDDAVGHWFKVKIPDNAKTFVAKGTGENTTVSGDIYEYRTKKARYRTDYTLGDMQYRILDTQTDGKYNLKRFYPIFTQDAVYTMPDHDDVSSSAVVNLVDESQVLDEYIDGSPTAPAKTTGTVDTPVLHETSSNTITYTWQEGGSSSGGTLYYDNSSTQWNTVYVHLWGGTNSTTWSGTPMTDEGDNIWSFNLSTSDYSDSTRAIFNKGDDSGKTSNLFLPDDTSSKNYILNAASTWGTSNYIYFKQPNGGFDSPNQSASWRDLKVELTDSNGNTTTYSDNDSGSKIEYIGSSHLRVYGTTSDISSYWRIEIDPTANWRKVKFYRRSTDVNAYTETVNLTDYGSGYGVGNYFYLTTYKAGENTLSTVQQVEEKNRNFSEYTSTTTYSSQFQPEDRYGYIRNTYDQSDTNGTGTTTNNFVKVVNNVSSLTDLHIKFFSDEGNNRVDTVDTSVSGSVISPYGIKLKPDVVTGTYPKIDTSTYTPVGDGTAANPYLVRLPKNAKYAQLYNGSTAVGDIVVLADDTGKTGGVTLTVSGTSSSQTVNKSYASRGGTDIQVNAKKTDIDYIYFTDTGSTSLGSNIHAYYFGDTDGEYCAWPGVAPSYSYKDNDNKTVYAFQYPTLAGSTKKAYPYVIFNDGNPYSSSTAMTQARLYSSAGNYKLDSSGTFHYGETVPTANIYSIANAQQSSETKTSNPTVNYSTTNKYLFFVNNGTYNLGVSGLSTRYTLDDVHITFFDMNKNPLQTTEPGYVMDKVGSYNKDGTSGDLYRIAIPSNAQYFQINNGTGKGDGTTNYNMRQSVIEEIAANGIYKFVDESTATADVWDGEAPENAAELDDHNYKLKLINKKVYESDDEEIPETSNYEVLLAKVETKNTTNSNSGNIAKIIWLKPAAGHEEENPQTTVDLEYLDYEGENIQTFLSNNSAATVKVKKLGTYYWKETQIPTGYKIPDGESDEKPFILTAHGTSPAIADVTFKNEKLPEPTNKVILTKTAKEKVGTTNIGDPLAGAVFKVFKSDGSTVTNFTDNYTTNSEGKLTIEGLPLGDYYLEEQNPPAGYTEKDSSNNKRRVYFSIGDNTVEKELVCSDEMAPAYIRLFEHINDFKPVEWGHPTFVFKITNTATHKTSLVSLTFDGTKATEQTIANTIKWYNGDTAVNYGAGNDPINNSKYGDWYVEGTTESEYKGVYHIDNQGRIKVEPGTYSITRIPVSRYEFVTSGHTVYATGTEPSEIVSSDITTGTETAETVTLTANQTADIHYYDKVAYYDKFSHVDEQINKFYKLDNSKKNTTVKGISVGNIQSGSVTITGTIGTVNVSAYKAFVDGTVDTTAISAGDLTIEFDSSISSDFSYSNGTITIQNATTTHAHKVYTVTAKYDHKFITTFDIAIP